MSLKPIEFIGRISVFLQTVFDDLKLMNHVIEELIRDAENEPETSIENIRSLNDIKIQHERMLTQFQVKTKLRNLCILYDDHR